MDEDTATKENDSDTTQYQAGTDELAFLAKYPQIPSVNSDVAKALLAGLLQLERNRTLWYKTTTETQLKQHLAFTLFVPGGSAKRAAEAVKILRDASLLTRFATEQQIMTATAGLVRFPKQKAQRLVRALKEWPEIRHGVVARMGGSVEHLHVWLIQRIEGFGPKAAAHFMRNTGLQSMSTQGIPIIDTHIRKFLKAVVSSDLESEAACAAAFSQLCKQHQLSLLLLDALIWSAYAGITDPSQADFTNFS